MRRIVTACVLLVAACDKGPDPEIARLNGALESLRREFADYRAAKERQIEEMGARLAEATQQAGLAAEAEAVKQRLADLQAATEAKLKDLQQGLEAKAREAADALARVGELEGVKAGLDARLKETKTLLDQRSADLNALKTELAQLKKLLGR
jgi:chromosome segregation ATPase